MIIRCPSCSTTYKVSGSVFDAPRPTFRCTRCKHIFTFQVRLQFDDEDPSAAATTTNAMPEASAAGERPVAASEPATGEDPHAEDHVDTHDGQTARVAPARPHTAASQGTLELPGTSADDDAESADQDFGETQADDDSGETRFVYPDFDPPVEADQPDLRQPESFEQTAAIEDDDIPVQDTRKPDFEIDDDFLIPPRREAEPPPPRPLPRANARGSIVPLVSLVVLAVFAFVLVALIYQVNPQPLDAWLRRIPWYGGTVFENRHFKSTLVFESLVSGVQPVLNQTDVFIVSGKLVNRNDRSVHKVRIETQLFDVEGKQIGREVTFVGNGISAKTIRDMPFREISMLQSLKPLSAYRILANETANFTVVFPKPDAAVESFSCRVISADAAA